MYTSLNIQKIIIRFLISLPITVSLVLTPYIPISASFRSEKVGCYDFMPDAAGSEGSPFMLEENAWANFEASRFNEGPQIATFIQQSVLSPNHVDGEPHSVVSLMHERHTMMHIFLADSHREWERHLLNRQQISNLDRLQEEIEEQLNKQEQKLQETQETLEKKLAEIEEEKQKLRERYGHEEQEEGIEGEHDFTPLQQRHLQEKSLFRQKEEDYILEERHQHEQIDLITKYLNEQLKLTRKHRTETNRINKLERISHQSKVDLICIRAAGQGDPTQDEIDRKTHDLLEAEHQREQEELTREHQQQLVGVEEEERAAIVERQQRARTDLEAQQQDEMTVVQVRDRYKREILLISKRQEERAHLTQQQILEEFSLKNRQEKEILIYKQRQRDELVRYHARLRAKESGRLLEDQESKMLTNLYEGNDSIFQQKWNNLIDSQDQQLIDLVAYHKKQKSALRRKNKAYETIFEDIANNDFTKSLIACTKAIRSDLKGRINTPDAKHHLTTIVKTLGVKRSLGIVEG